MLDWVKTFSVLGIVFLLFPAMAVGQLNSRRLLDNGRNALFFQDYAIAIDYFNRAASLRPSDPTPLLLRAIAKIQLEDFSGAVIDCNKSLQINPYQPNAFYARGFANNRLERYDSAIADFNKALEFSPDNATYFICRSESFFRLKRYDDALRDAENALKIQHLDKKATDYLYLQKCHLLLCKSDTNASLRLSDSLIRANVLRPEMYSLKGLISLMREREDSALAFYDQSIRLGYKNANSFYNRAVLRHRFLQYDSAICDLTRVVALTDSSFNKQDIELHNQALFSRALIRHEVGDLDNCMNDLDTLLSLETTHENGRYLRATTALEKGLYRTARSDFQYLINTYPHFVPAYYGAAQALRALGNKRQESIYLYKAHQIEQDAHRKRTRGLLADSDVVPIDTTKHQRLYAMLETYDDASFSFESNLTNNDKTRGNIQDLPSSNNPRPLYCIAFLSMSDALGRDQRQFIPEIDSVNHVRHTHFVLTCSPVLNSVLTSRQISVLPNDLQEFQRQYLQIRSRLTSDSSAYENLPLPNDFSSSILPFALYNQATYYLLKGDYQLAEMIYSKALAVDRLTPSFRANILYNRALTRIKLNRIDNAINDLSTAGDLGVYQSYALLKKLSETQK